MVTLPNDIATLSIFLFNVFISVPRIVSSATISDCLLFLVGVQTRVQMFYDRNFWPHSMLLMVSSSDLFLFISISCFTFIYNYNRAV